MQGVVGVALLIVGGRLIVYGAISISAAWGLDEFAVGATIVAVGTSVSELATAIISRLRGHDEVGLGAILGSNVLNGLFIIGVTAAIAPITIGPMEIAPVLVLGIAAVVLTLPRRSGEIERWRGGLLLLVYAAHLVMGLKG